MQILDTQTSGITNPAASGAGATSGTQAASGKARAAAAGAGAPTDAVELSSFAQQINDLQAESTGRDARVEQLRALYQGGNYKVDSSAVAGRIIDDAFVF
jgi:flagellar biosynthesis anti-sigma factor FlgM